MIEFIKTKSKSNYNMFLFENKEKMLNCTFMKENDFATVYKYNTEENINNSKIISNKEYDNITFPSVVTLDIAMPQIPEEVISEAKARNKNQDNIIILQNTKTKEFYIPVGHEKTNYSTNWMYVQYNEITGYITPGWQVLWLYKYQNGEFVEVPCSTTSTNSVVQYDWGDYQLVPVYAKMDILYRSTIGEHQAGSVFFKANNYFIKFGEYPSQLPYMSIDGYKAEFYFNGFTEKVIYNSLDGTVYTRTDNLPLNLECNVIFTDEIINSILAIFPKTNLLPYEINGIYQYKNSTWDLVPSLSDIVDTDVLKNKYAFSNIGTIRGTMPNNGELNYTPSTSAQSIPEGYTSGGTIAAVDNTVDSNIIASNIKSGVTILGVTGTLEEGTDTTDANAVSSDIVSDKTAYVNGEKIIGNVQEVTTYIYDIYTGAEFNLGGALLIKSDIIENALYRPGSIKGINLPTSKFAEFASVIGLTADKIKAGETILGITGTYTGESSEVIEEG